jgi:hypothetical protein
MYAGLAIVIYVDKYIGSMIGYKRVFAEFRQVIM